VPFFVTGQKRNKHALVEMVLVEYANGVFSRKVGRIVSTAVMATTEVTDAGIPEILTVQPISLKS
jgi:hypothetical protein